VKGQLLGVAATIIIIGSTGYGFNNWKAQQGQRQEAVSALAPQHLKDREVQARALAAGLSVEAYAEAEKAEAGKLVSALDTAKNEAEVDAVIDQHSAAIEAQIHAEDAEVKSRGEQKFLGQERKEQRITTDMKQEIQRAEKAVADDCQ